MRKVFFVLLLIIGALLQQSFLPYFSIMGAFPNLIFIVFFLAVFFEEKHQYYWGILFAGLCGLVLDIFSPFRFGYSIIILAILYLATKVSIYMIKERQDKYLVFYFAPMFLVAYSLYIILINLFAHFPRIGVTWQEGVASLVYNVLVALVIFYLYQWFQRATSHRQLRLFD